MSSSLREIFFCKYWGIFAVAVHPKSIGGSATSACYRNLRQLLTYNNPLGSKCEALRLRVHLILLYIIRILVVGTEIIFLFCGCGCGCGCGWRTFFVFKSLDNNMVYTFDIDVYVCKRNRCTTKVLWVLKFWEVGGQEIFFQNHGT